MEEKLDKILEMTIRNTCSIESIEKTLDKGFLIPKSLPKIITYIIAIPSSIAGLIIAIKKIII